MLQLDTQSREGYADGRDSEAQRSVVIKELFSRVYNLSQERGASPKFGSAVIDENTVNLELKFLHKQEYNHGSIELVPRAGEYDGGFYPFRHKYTLEGDAANLVVEVDPDRKDKLSTEKFSAVFRPNRLGLFRFHQDVNKIFGTNGRLVLEEKGLDVPNELEVTLCYDKMPAYMWRNLPSEFRGGIKSFKFGNSLASLGWPSQEGPRFRKQGNPSKLDILVKDPSKNSEIVKKALEKTGIIGFVDKGNLAFVTPEWMTEYENLKLLEDTIQDISYGKPGINRYTKMKMEGIFGADSFNFSGVPLLFDKEEIKMRGEVIGGDIIVRQGDAHSLSEFHHDYDSQKIVFNNSTLESLQRFINTGFVWSHSIALLFNNKDKCISTWNFCENIE